jgi:hypothetical protein
MAHTTSHQNATNTTAKASDGTQGPKRGVIQPANTVRYHAAWPRAGSTICMTSEPA